MNGTPRVTVKVALTELEETCIAFVEWYIKECWRQDIPVDGLTYDLPDAYSDWVESHR